MTVPITAEELAIEVGSGNFDDERLNLRLRNLVGRLSVDPSRSLPRALDSAGLEGAYRFLSNHRVTPELILRPHLEATRSRTESEGDFLIVHDSTKFLYRYDGEREGLGRVKRTSVGGKQAFFAHLSLAIAADGTRRPLGIVGFKTWIRGPEATGLECLRWEEQIRLSSAQLHAVRNAIHVMDREADDYRMFDSLMRDGHRFVARCQYNRKLETELGIEKLYDVLARVSATAERDVPLSKRKPKKDPVAEKIHPSREARLAKLSIAATTVQFKRPLNLKPDDPCSPTITINVVRVWEPAPPEGEQAIEWVLLTNEPIATPAQRLAIVDHYRARWVIEEYIKAIKSGCDFEKRQIQDYEGLVNLLAVFAPIAYHMLLIRSEARRTPDAAATEVVSQDHIDVLRVCGRLKLSPNPTTREVYLAIAALGGHLKHNGDPGWSTLAYGLEELEKLTRGWVAAKLQLRSDQS
jgi:hypothetical protein